MFLTNMQLFYRLPLAAFVFYSELNHVLMILKQHHLVWVSQLTCTSTVDLPGLLTSHEFYIFVLSIMYIVLYVKRDCFNFDISLIIIFANICNWCFDTINFNSKVSIFGAFFFFFHFFNSLETHYLHFILMQ